LIYQTTVKWIQSHIQYVRLCAGVSRPVVPNRGFPDPKGSEARFFGVRNAIFEGESLYVLGSKNRDLWRIANAIAQKRLFSL